MFLKRFYNDHLAQASYLVGCHATGEAIVVDPVLDPALYLAAAAAEGLRVTQVTETHIHADFVSGARALAAAGGARLLLSAEGGDGWEYAYAAGEGATLLRGGDRTMVGNVALDVVHTPGHTPEHLSFVVSDTPAASGPMGVLSGDFVFVGDVGRPDLLERAAGHAGTALHAAHTLFRSLRWFRTLPDHLQLWPGHGAGSACGKALGAVPSSTVGYERVANWAVRAEREDAFVRDVLAGQPTPPAYFAEMKRINRDAPPSTWTAAPVALRTPEEAFGGDSGARIALDLRPTAAFAAGHLRGALNAPFGRSFMRWVGALLDPRSPAPIVLVAADEGAAQQAAYTLSLVGRSTSAWCDAAATLAWAARCQRWIIFTTNVIWMVTWK